MNKYLFVLLFLLLLFVGSGVAYAQDGGRLDASADASFFGETNGEYAATNLAMAGDVNGDGYADYLIGSPYNTFAGPTVGSAFLILGTPGTPDWGLRKGLGQSPIIRYYGEFSGDWSGWAVSGAGDVNDDGYDDFIISAPDNNEAGAVAGAVYLVLGSASPTGGNLGSLANVYQYSGVTDDRAGWELAGPGDVNGDGYDDFVVGAYSNNTAGTDAGRAYLVLGSSAPAGGSLSSAIIYGGLATNDWAGWDVGAAGDVNGDGYKDFLIGAPGRTSGTGASYLILGSASPTGGSLAGAITYTGETTSNSSGANLDGAGDVNGDGYDDFLISAYGNDEVGADAGAAYLVLGNRAPASANLSTAIQYSGEAAGDNAGSDVTGIGDVNGDGYADFLVGASFNDEGGNLAGAAYLLWGSPAPAGGSLASALKYLGPQADDRIASDVTGGGDANGDGYPDFLINAYTDDNAAVNAGAAYLFFSDALSSHTPAFRQRHNLLGSGDTLPLNFDQTGVWFDFTAGALSGGNVSVTRHAFHPCSTDKWLQMPIWTVESNKMTAGATVDLRFKYNDSQIEGMNEANLVLWTRPAGRPCAPWTQVAGSSVDATHNIISATGLTGLGQFTIADAAPSPTAVRDVSMGVVLAQEPVWLVVLLVLLVLSAGATYWYLRRAAGLETPSPLAAELQEIKRLLAEQRE